MALAIDKPCPAIGENLRIEPTERDITASQSSQGGAIPSEEEKAAVENSLRIWGLAP